MKILQYVPGAVATILLTTACSDNIDAPSIPEPIDIDSLIHVVPVLNDAGGNASRVAQFGPGGEIEAASLAERCPSISLLIRNSYYYSVDTEETKDDGTKVTHKAGDFKDRSVLFHGWLNHQGNDYWGFHKKADENDAASEVKLYWPYHIDDNHPTLSNGDYYRNIEFFALANLPEGDKINNDPDCPYYIYRKETVDDDAKEVSMRDILYGVAVEQRKPTDGENRPLKLEMAHAMAKIQFEYEVLNPNIEVVIENTELYNMWLSASMSIAWDHNPEPCMWHSHDLHNTAGYITRGDGYRVMDRVIMRKDGRTHYATFNNDVHENYRGKRFYHLIIPQNSNRVTKWIEEEGIWKEITLKEKAGIQLWMGVKDLNGNWLRNEAGYYIDLPDNTQWKPGYVYTYKFVFEGDEWNPVIKVDCTVADWTTEIWDVPVN